MRLIIKDIDFKNKQISIYDAKGGNFRFSILPDLVIKSLKQHMIIISKLYNNQYSKLVNIETTMIYLHDARNSGHTNKSPLDKL
jgi:hypothetical protein